MRVLVVFGTRPEAIKMCPLILELKKNKTMETILCITGQHKGMLDQVMRVFDLTADYNLSIMKDKQSLSMITSAVLSRMEFVIVETNPDIVLVHGDTTTSFAAGLAAFYHNIPVGHVEAGLRTYDINAPYPEEFNRQAVDIFTKFYFVPTNVAKQNLINEGKKESDIYVTGNTVIDALNITISEGYFSEHLEWAKDSKMILVTAHRRENIGRPMEEMFSAIRQIVYDNADVKVIYPIHKNPLVREIASKYLKNHERIRIIEPLDVIAFHNFMKESFFIMTDSGGVQEEATALGKPVLVMRNVTERPEGVETGSLKLVGTNFEKIYQETSKLLIDKEMYEKMRSSSSPYGDGRASEKIVEVIRNYAENISSFTSI